MVVDPNLFIMVLCKKRCRCKVPVPVIRGLNFGCHIFCMFCFRFWSGKNDASVKITLTFSVADPDPGSGIRCLFDPYQVDPGWDGLGCLKNQDPDPKAG
jgi:hypothetical protein